MVGWPRELEHGMLQHKASQITEQLRMIGKLQEHKFKQESKRSPMQSIRSMCEPRHIMMSRTCPQVGNKKLANLKEH